MAPDSPDLYPMLTVAEHFRFRAQAYRLDGPVDDRIGESMHEAGVDDLADRRGGELSRGQRQRVMLAAAVLQRALLYVLDEPTVGLDPPGLAWLESWLGERARAGAAVLVATHHLDFMARVSHRAVLIQNGVVAAHLTVPPDGSAELREWRQDVVSRFTGGSVTAE